MSKDARNDDLELTAEEKEKFGELVAWLARHGFGAAGPPRETTFAQMERFGHQAGQMVALAIDARLAEQHAATLRARSPVLPAVRSTCRKRACTICVYRPRMAKSNFASRPSAARPVSGIFFPQRIPLRIDGGSVSPAVLEKKMLAVAYAPSYSIGELLLRKIGGIELSGRGLNKTAVKIGLEMVAQRDARIEAYFDQPLPRQHAEPKTPITLACVSVDGGRMQTRDEGGGKGVHHPHWRENKNALFLRMKSGCFADDPQPDLPACFANRERMKKLLSGIGEGNTPPAAAEEAAAAADIAEKHVENDWRPERLFRTCLSSLADSNAFGRMMEVEADARGFYHAAKKAFVGDGLPYNWAIQSDRFGDFTPILDFVHAVEHLYEAARSAHDDVERRWTDYLRWAAPVGAGTFSR